jgi:hypothetical protein
MALQAATLRPLIALNTSAIHKPPTTPAICARFIATVYLEKSGEVLQKNHLTNIIDL